MDRIVLGRAARDSWHRHSAIVLIHDSHPSPRDIAARARDAAAAFVHQTGFGDPNAT